MANESASTISTTPSLREQLTLGTRRLLHDVFAHDYAEKSAIARAAMAAGYGLDPAAYARPFPGSSTNVTIHPAGNGGGGTLAKAALALALVGGGGAGGLALSAWNNRPPAAAAAPAPPAVALPAEREFELRWELRDGKLQQTIEDVTGKPHS